MDARVVTICIWLLVGVFLHGALPRFVLYYSLTSLICWYAVAQMRTFGWVLLLARPLVQCCTVGSLPRARMRAIGVPVGTPDVTQRRLCAPPRHFLVPLGLNVLQF